jgi:hypothetical protein
MDKEDDLPIAKIINEIYLRVKGNTKVNKTTKYLFI